MKQVPKQIKAIIFDMDGVIVDSEPLHVESEKITLSDFQIEAPHSEWEHFKGKTDKDMFEYIVNNFTDGNVSVTELMAYRVKIYLQIAPKRLRMIPGALSFVKKVKQSDKKLALTTSSLKGLQQLVFEKFNLYYYFDVVITGDEIIKGKPDPEPYLKTVQKLQIPAKYCVVIEDSVNGIISAKASSCIAVGITTSFPREKLVEAGADYVVSSFSELSNYLHF